jgi:hypothetical protein
MVLVNMREDVGLTRHHTFGVVDLGEDILRLEIADAAEAGDQESSRLE